MVRIYCTVGRVLYCTTRAIESEPAIHSPEPDSPNAAGLGSFVRRTGKQKAGGQFGAGIASRRDAGTRGDVSLPRGSVQRVALCSRSDLI